MKTQMISMQLPQELVKKIDEQARKIYQSRTDYFRDSIVRRLKEDQEWDEIFAEGQKIGKRIGIKSEQDVYDIMYELRHGNPAKPKGHT